MPADDLTGHIRLSAVARVPIVVGESLYSPGVCTLFARLGMFSSAG